MSTSIIDLSPAHVGWMISAGDTIKLPFNFYDDPALTKPADLSGMDFTAELINCKGVTIDGVIQILGSYSLVIRFPEQEQGTYRYVLHGRTISNGDKQTLVAGDITITNEIGVHSCGY